MNGAPPPVVPYVTILRAVERILRTAPPDAVGTVTTEDAAEAAATTAGHKQQQQRRRTHQQQLEQDVSSPPQPSPPTPRTPPPTTASSRKRPREEAAWGSDEGELDDDRIEGGHRWEKTEDRAKTKSNRSISRKLADGYCHHRHANVVAVVVGVSAPTATPRRRTNPRHHKRYLWIVDPSVGARDNNYGRRDGGGDEDDQHQERAAVVTYYGGSSSSSISAVDTIREGDVVALHGLVLTKECQRRLLDVRGDERRPGEAGQQSYEFVHDARASVLADHPQIPAVLLLAHVPKGKGTTKRICYYHDRNSNAPHRRPEFSSSVPSSELERAASEVIDWYVRWNAVAPTTTATPPPTRRGAAGVRDGGDDDNENDDEDCGGRDGGYHRCVVVQRSVSDLLLGGGRCGSGRRGTTVRVVSHLVARVTAVHECATRLPGDEGSRGATNCAARSRRRRCRESFGTRELCAATNNCTVALLSDATSELPIPLVMQRNQHGKLRQRLADLMSSFKTALDDDDDDAPSRSLWLRFTHLESVWRHDALWGAADCAPDHDNANAMALVPTSDTTVSVAPRDEPIDSACQSQPSQAGDFILSQRSSASACILCPADRTWTTTTVTIEAPIASIRVDFSGGTTIVLNASNVREAVPRVLPLLRRHDERWTKSERDGRRRPHTDGDGNEVVVSIALELDDDDNEDHPRTHHPADWPAIRSLLWGGSDRDAVQSGPLDDIAGRMVAGMLQESIRFSWIVERRRGGATQDATAPFRIVDVSLRQL